MNRNQAANGYLKQMSFLSSSLDGQFKSDRLTQTYRETNMEEMEWSDSCVDSSNLSFSFSSSPSSSFYPPMTMTKTNKNSISPSSLLCHLKISDVPTRSSALVRTKTIHEHSPSTTFTSFSEMRLQTTNGQQNFPSFKRFINNPLSSVEKLEITTKTSQLEDDEEEENGGMCSDCSMLSEPIQNLDVGLQNEKKKNKEKTGSLLDDAVNASSNALHIYLLSVIKISFIILLASIYLQYFYSMQDVCPLNIDLTAIHNELIKRVHGQDLAVQIVMETFQSFLKIDLQSNAKRNILVLSFQGWSGIGKNHMSGIISSFFESTKVHKFIVTLHFAHNSEEDVSNLNEWFLSNVTLSHGIHLFIFDEVDKSNERFISGLRETLIVAGELLSHQNDTKAIVLLLSNTASSVINAYTAEALQEGINRQNISYEEILKRLNALPEDVTWYSEMLRENVINQIVPFLPLERVHVEKCIIAALEERGLTYSDDIIRAVIDRLTFFPPSSNIFSQTGCRRVPSQLDLVIF